MGIRSKAKERNALKGLEDLEDINLDIANELINEQIDIKEMSEKLQKERQETVGRIRKKEKDIKEISKDIEEKRNERKQIKQQMKKGKISKYVTLFRFIRPKYLKLCIEIHKLKKEKRVFSKDIKNEHEKFNNILKNEKENRKKLKSFEEKIKQAVQKHKGEIKFIKDFEKNFEKIEQLNDDTVKGKIMQYAKDIRANNGKWQDKDKTPEEAIKLMYSKIKEDEKEKKKAEKTKMNNQAQTQTETEESKKARVTEYIKTHPYAPITEINANLGTNLTTKDFKNLSNEYAKVQQESRKKYGQYVSDFDTMIKNDPRGVEKAKRALNKLNRNISLHKEDTLKIEALKKAIEKNTGRADNQQGKAKDQTHEQAI